MCHAFIADLTFAKQFPLSLSELVQPALIQSMGDLASLWYLLHIASKR